MSVEANLGGRSRKWVKLRKKEDGSWIVFCMLCGKRFTRQYFDERDGDAESTARQYLIDHLGGSSHAAAVAAYRAIPGSRISAEVHLVSQIFGTVIDDEPETRRKSAARQAAETELNEVLKREDAERQAALPRCSFCDLPVSMSAAKVDARVANARGGWDHVRCLALEATRPPSGQDD